VNRSPSPPPLVCPPPTDRRKSKVGSKRKQSVSGSHSAVRRDPTVQRIMKQDELCEMLESMGFPSPVVQQCLSQMHISKGRRTVIDANALIEQLLSSAQAYNEYSRSGSGESLPSQPIPEPFPPMHTPSLSSQDSPSTREEIPLDVVEGFSLNDSSCCKICFEGPIETAILRCGHLALCLKCSNAGLKKCPICRKEITEIVRIYHV